MDAEDIVKDMTLNTQVHGALDLARAYLADADGVAGQLPDGGGVFGTGIDLRASAKDDINTARTFVEGILAMVPDDNAEVAPVNLTAARKAVRISQDVLGLVRQVSAKVGGHDLVGDFVDAVAELANKVTDAAGDVADHAVDRVGDTAKKAGKKISQTLIELLPGLGIALGAAAAGAAIYLGVKVIR